MRQLLTGLHYCHAHQILHRDIKGGHLTITLLMLGLFIASYLFVDL